MSDQYTIGMDVGGSRIKAGLLNTSGEVVRSTMVPTPNARTPRVVMDCIVQLVRQLCEDCELRLDTLAGIGIGFPGLVDPGLGVVKACVNLDDWHNVPVNEMLANRLSGVKVAIANDANAAALGEYHAHYRNSPLVQHMALVTLGTGVGSGVVLGGEIFTGGGGLAGEVGHMIVRANGRKCPCGQYGCLERYVSATAIVDQVLENVKRGAASSLADVVNDPARRVTTEDIFKAARDGDTFARRVVYQAAEYLAIGCVNLCRVIDLQAIIIGGGVAGAGEEFLKPLFDQFRVQNWAIAEAPTPEIRFTKLGSDAGFVGCAVLAQQKFIPTSS